MNRCKGTGESVVISSVNRFVYIFFSVSRGHVLRSGQAMRLDRRADRGAGENTWKLTGEEVRSFMNEDERQRA